MRSCSVMALSSTVPERYASEVKIGQSVQVRTDSFPDRTFTGIVTRVSPTVDTLNRTFQVEIEVPGLALGIDRYGNGVGIDDRQRGCDIGARA